MTDEPSLKNLKAGAILTKYKPNGKKYSRRFFLRPREDSLTYEKSHKFLGKPKIYYIKDFDEIRSGLYTNTFDRLVKRGLLKEADQSRAFSIHYDNHRQSEHFVAPDSHTRDVWVTGLQHLMDQHARKGPYHLLQEDSWILGLFHAADKNESNTLSRNECRNLLAKHLNLVIPTRTFKQIFNKVDKNGEGVLSPSEFLTLFNILARRKDLYEIMKKYVLNRSTDSMESIYMNVNELRSFLLETRNRNITNIQDPERLLQLIKEYEKQPELKSRGYLSLDGFRNMLLSKEFDIVQSIYMGQIYQDMTRPLCDYFINTSHNTYLFDSQISGDSDPEAYNRVLLMGCRAVEFDCYDGDNGQPIVKHAFTFVRPCPLESIIRVMAPNIFKASPYPVILNIENHCSEEQQIQIARILKQYFGDKLVTKHLPNKDSTTLPSPEDLKYRVIVRSKKVSPSKDSDGTMKEKTVECFSLRAEVSPELAELFIYLQNVPYREYDYAKAHYSPFHSSSLAENDLIKSAEKDPVGLVQQTTWRLIRVYPGGVRQDSSNPDPVNSWNLGVQLAALNFQSDDDMMALNYGKFLDNGGCGYVLKPDYLINAHESLFNPFDDQMSFDYPLSLTIKVISGQFLPRSSEKSKDIPDSYVRVSIHGIPCDQHSQKTQVVDNNGFDPIWNETFEFPIKFPQMCLIYFAVMDYDGLSKDDRVAFFCAPLTMIQTGYTHVHLRANNNDPIHATLFVHIDIRKAYVYDTDNNIIRTQL